MLYKDLDLKTQVWLAELYDGGRLPASVLCNATKLHAWLKAYDLPAAECPYTMWQRISAVLSGATNDDGGVRCPSACNTTASLCKKLGQLLAQQLAS